MHQTRSIHELLHQIRRGEVLLPEFQRGYVWNRDQVRGLMQSLYRSHPTGHLLIWSTYKPSLVRGTEAPSAGQSLLLLDGQQRLTTLFVLFFGEPPDFYEGEDLFFDLHFNVQTEEFRFWQPSRMQHDPAWIGVHEFFRVGVQGLLQATNGNDDRRSFVLDHLEHLNQLDQVRRYTYTVDQISGDDFSVDEVVEIFNRINSKGTPLTRADLALAHICSLWPEARGELRRFSSRMGQRGFGVDLGFLVRCLAAIATGSVILEGSFRRTPVEDLQAAWGQLQPAFEYLTGLLRHEAFIADLGELPSNNVLLPATAYLACRGGRFPSEAIKRRFIRWLHLAGLWARYSGASETKLQQDVALVTGNDADPTHELEDAILRERGRVTLEAADLERATINSAVARLSRVVARSRGARDWFTGTPIFDPAATGNQGEDRHHIFPSKILRQAGFDDRRIHAVANRAVLVSEPPRDRRNLAPADYLPELEQRFPGTLQAQSLPMDPELWKTENFLDFMAERRRLLADALNHFIASWTPEVSEEEIDEQGVRQLLAAGENERVEFKSSLRWDWNQERVNKALEQVIVKTIAGFLNADGGTLLMGIEDSGAPCGVQADYDTLTKSPNRDGFELHLRQLVERDLGHATAASFLTVNFHEIDGKDVCQVTIERSDRPVYVEAKGKAVFFVRSGNATKQLPLEEAVIYNRRHWA